MVWLKRSRLESFFHTKKYTIEHRKEMKEVLNFTKKDFSQRGTDRNVRKVFLYSEFSPVFPEDCGCSAPPSWSNWCNKQRNPVCFRLVCAGFSLRCSRFPPSVPVCLSSNRRREQRPLRRRNPAALLPFVFTMTWLPGWPFAWNHQSLPEANLNESSSFWKLFLPT